MVVLRACLREVLTGKRSVLGVYMPENYSEFWQYYRLGVSAMYCVVEVGREKQGKHQAKARRLPLKTALRSRMPGRS